MGGERIKENWLGFNVFDSDWIELESGCFRPRANLMTVVGEMAVFREVFFHGSDSDFQLMLENLKASKQKKERAYWVGFILTAQNGWTKRDQQIFDVMFSIDDLYIALERAFLITKNNAESKVRHHNRMIKLKSRKTGIPRGGDPIFFEDVFKRDIDLMLSYLEKATSENVEIYSKIKELTTNEILNLSFYKKTND